MNNKTIQHIIASALFAAILLPLSCSREELQSLTPALTPAVNVHGGEVTVSLSLGIAGEEAGTPEARKYLNAAGTKAVNDPDSTSGAANTKINDFYLLQFNGDADTCKLIGCQYFKYDDFISSSNPNGAGKVKLISSTKDDAIFILANTCDSRMVFLNGMLMSDLKSRMRSITSQADLLGKGAAKGSGTSFPDDRDYHIMMNARVNKTITSETELSLSLKRNVARVRVKINNTTATDDPANPVTIKTLTIRNVPTTSPYITYTTNGQTSLPAIYPTEELIQTFDYPAEPYKEAGNVFYVPVNKRGTRDNDKQSWKGVYAPENATYLFVEAEYGAGAVKRPVTYTFYLGANLTNDYNLCPNSAYTYTITMKKKGNPEIEYRMEDWGTVDFTPSTVERANCYILNPSPLGDRQFKIPIDRIWTFWGGLTKDDGTLLYEKYDSTTTPAQLMNKKYSAYILWTDIEDINDKVTVDMTGHDSGSGAYFTATVKPGTEGNAVVAVQNNLGADEILWSWHLWITDYRPDELHRYSPENGRYIYEVTGGAVHRYAGDIWETGIYKNKFIMDRNLGALDTANVALGKGAVFYQFGRKDPLPGPRTAALYYPKSDLPQSLRWKPIGKSDAGAAFADSTAVRYSVRYPLAFIKAEANGWTCNNKYNPKVAAKDWPKHPASKIVWQDPNVLDDAGKSLFDPCPPGYKVPKVGTWSDFRTATSTNPTTNINGGNNPPRNLPKWSSTNRGGKNQTGLHYYPGTGDVGKTIYYPASGYLYCASGVSYYGGSRGRCWGCSPCLPSYAYHLSFESDTVYPSATNNYRAFGFPVRCVQE